ncbi:cation:proton antiporter [Sulfurimonas sp.]|uniref:cation:proton antiporter domain-containing protein n=1 Tax=Sulfurimonas sp. TaxID=2022749 RepID=UPI00356229C0
MDKVLFIIVLALGISTVLNLLLKKVGVSQIIGYIFTGTILAYSFGLQDSSQSNTLEHIGEFGIVFLMFTIGLEISLSKMNNMKKEIFGNGFMQATFTALAILSICFFIFNLDFVTSLIISTAFALSSTAVVLSYLKSSKEIYAPYGQRATGILIFQDIAVIPLLILLGFLTNDAEHSVWIIIKDTVISALIVVGILFFIGRKVVSWLLHFSASSEEDELFMGSVLFIVISASLLASYFGFTYSLGAFVAGMVIAETKYHHKVEYDIAPFKDILLGTFFIVVGMKINISYFLDNVALIIGIFILVLILKTLITFMVLKISTNSSTSLKTALSISQVGEFSFVIFAVASVGGLIDKELESLLLLIVIFSMLITPFFISHINHFVDSFIKDDYIALLDEKAFKTREGHIIVCGYSDIGKSVAEHLDEMKLPYVIIDNNPKNVQLALKQNKEAYLGDMSELAMIEALHTENCASVIVTLDNIDKKKAVCETIRQYTKDIHLIAKVVSQDEKNKLRGIDIDVIVDGKYEVGRILVDKMMVCQMRI